MFQILNIFGELNFGNKMIEITESHHNFDFWINYILQIDTMSRRPGHGRGGLGSQGQAAPDVNGNQPSTAPRARGRGWPPGHGRGPQVARSSRGQGRPRRHHPYQSDFIDQSMDDTAAESGDTANNDGLFLSRVATIIHCSLKICRDGAVKNLLLFRNQYQSSTALGWDPVSSSPTYTKKLHFDIKGVETNLYTFRYWLVSESIQIYFLNLSKLFTPKLTTKSLLQLCF